MAATATGVSAADAQDQAPMSTPSLVGGWHLPAFMLPVVRGCRVVRALAGLLGRGPAASSPVGFSGLAQEGGLGWLAPLPPASWARRDAWQNLYDPGWDRHPSVDGDRPLHIGKMRPQVFDCLVASRGPPMPGATSSFDLMLIQSVKRIAGPNSDRAFSTSWRYPSPAGEASADGWGWMPRPVDRRSSGRGRHAGANLPHPVVSGSAHADSKAQHAVDGSAERYGALQQMFRLKSGDCRSSFLGQ